MPQPIQGEYLITWGSRGALARSPGLAAHIGRVAGLWAQLDFELGIMLVHILGSDAQIPIDVYADRVSVKDRLDMIRKLAQPKLGADKHPELEDLLSTFRKKYDERNTIVHGLWGSTETNPVRFAHTSLSEYLTFCAKELFSPTLQQENPSVSQEAKVRFYTQVRIYEDRDFDAVVARGEELLSRIVYFGAGIRKANRLAMLDKQQAEKLARLRRG